MSCNAADDAARSRYCSRKVLSTEAPPRKNRVACSGNASTSVASVLNVVHTPRCFSHVGHRRTRADPCAVNTTANSTVTAATSSASGT